MSASPVVLTCPSGSGRARNDQMRLVAAAARADLTREPGPFWDVFCINGIARPEIRPAVGQLIRDGLLVDPAPHATTSTLEPTTKGLNKIGIAR